MRQTTKTILVALLGFLLLAACSDEKGPAALKGRWELDIPGTMAVNPKISNDDTEELKGVYMEIDLAAGRFSSFVPGKGAADYSVHSVDQEGETLRVELSLDGDHQKFNFRILDKNALEFTEKRDKYILRRAAQAK